MLFYLGSILSCFRFIVFFGIITAVKHLNIFPLIIIPYIIPFSLQVEARRVKRDRLQPSSKSRRRSWRVS